MNKTTTVLLLFVSSAFAQGTLNSYGDSIGCGVGATSRYIDAVVADQGKTLWDHCWSGKQLEDDFPSVYYVPTTTYNDSEAVIMMSYNGMRLNGTNGAALRAFAGAIRSIIGWSAIPTSSLTLATSGAVAYTGTWSTTSSWPTVGKWSGTTGDTASFTVYGKTVYIDTIQYAGTTRGIRVNIDGVDYGTYRGETFVPTHYGTPYSPYLIQIRNLPLANHAVTLTVTAGTGNAYFNWGVGLDGSTPAPIVTAASTIPMTATAYTLPAAAPFDKGSTTAVTLYNEVIKDAVRGFVQDGLSNVGYADVTTGFDLVNCVAPDQVHPNNCGHAFIATQIINSIHQVGLIHGMN